MPSQRHSPLPDLPRPNDTEPGGVWRDRPLDKLRTLLGNALRRRIIVHYHLFKNAGSSVDHVLASNFGGRWQPFEGEHAHSNLSPEQLADHIRRHPRVLALSSHHLRLPLPTMPDADIYPIFFLRHPIDRIGSIYAFLRRRGGGNPMDIHLAANSLKDYVTRILEDEGNACLIARDCQTLFLSTALARWPDPDRPLRAGRTHLTEAKDFLDSLPVFGLVERFDESARRLEAWLRGAFPGIRFFSARLNAEARQARPLEERLNAMEAEIGTELYRDLIEANRHDLDLYHHACQRFAEARTFR